MAYNRGSTFRRSGTRTGGGSSDRTPLQNIAVIVSAFEIAVKGKSNPDKDVLVGHLAHSVPEMNLVAEFDADQNPITEVRVMMPPPKDGQGAGRRDIFGLTQKKGAGDPMGPGSVVVFEKGWVDRKDGTIKALYAHGGPSLNDRNANLKQIYPTVMVCVLPERTDREGRPVGRQEVMIADVGNAQLVTNDAELKAVVEEMLKQGETIGTHGFQIQARQIAPEGSDPVAFAADPNTRIAGAVFAKPKNTGTKDAAVWTPVTPDEVIAKFWDSQRDVKAVWANANYQFELVPMVAVNQAKSLVPSKRDPRDRARDNSKTFELYGDVDPNDKYTAGKVAVGDRTLGVFDYGWAESHVIVERKAEDSFAWYSTYQRPMSTRPTLFAMADLITPNMPDYHRVAAEAEAAKLADNRRAVAEATRAPGAEGEEAAPAPGR